MSDGPSTSEFHEFSDEGLIDRALGEQDEDTYWRLIAELHRRGSSEIADRAIRLAVSADGSERETACDVLGQLGFNDEHPYRHTSIPMLMRLAETDTEWFVVQSAVLALGHLGAGRAVQVVTGLASHASPEVRHAVAVALPAMLGVDPVPADNPGVAALVRLMSDGDSDVRDWATFGIGTQSIVDSDQIRDALSARLDDTDGDTRFEALVGLARRHDPRAIEATISALGRDDDWFGGLRAAELLRSPSLLTAIRQVGEVAGSADTELAEQRCDPGRHAAEVKTVEELVTLGAALGPDIQISASSELLSSGDGAVQITVVTRSGSGSHDLDAVMDRGGGSARRAVELIAEAWAVPPA